MTPRQEKRLIRLLKQRDEEAFQRVVAIYQHKVYNLIYRMLGDAQEAEDLVQEVFLTVFRSIHTFRAESKLSTWLYRIATNHAKNRIKYLARRHSRKRASLEDAEEGEGSTHALVPTTSRPDRAAMGRELEGVIQRAIASLDEEHRMLIVLREIQSLSYGEIAEITELRVGTVKSRLHRARLLLKEAIDAYQSGEPAATPPPQTSARSALPRRKKEPAS